MANIEIVIKIPEKEFGIDIDDKFQDFFSRLKAEIKAHLITNTSLVCGAYELETIDMFLKAFNDSVPLPKDHGDLIDKDRLLDELEKTVKSVDDTNKHLLFWDRAVAHVHLSKPIIEAESEDKE